MQDYAFRLLSAIFSTSLFFTSTTSLPINGPVPDPTPNDIQTLNPNINSIFKPLCQQNNATNILQNFTLQVPGEIPITPVPVPVYNPLPVPLALDGQTPVSCQSVGKFAFQDWDVTRAPIGNSQTMCLPGAHKYALVATLAPSEASTDTPSSNPQPGLAPMQAPLISKVTPWYSQPGGTYQELKSQTDFNQFQPPDPRAFRHVGELSWELPANKQPGNPNACMNVHFQFEFSPGVGVQNVISGAIAIWDVPGNKQPDGGGWANNYPEDSLVETTGSWAR